MDMSLSKLWEFVIDMEARRAAIHGVTKSSTQLSDWAELNTSGILFIEVLPQDAFQEYIRCGSGPFM